MRYDLSLFPYKIQLTQKLQQNDSKKRLDFANWFLKKCEDETFLSHLMMSDEAHFYLDGMVSKQNCRIWAEENPMEVHEQGLHGLYVTVWCGITMRGIVGPYFFENEEGDRVTVTGERYKDMFENFVLPQLKNLKLSRGLWFQQDGATSHTSNVSMGLLKRKFKGTLISNKGDIPWPPRSPDLTAPDFYLWGYLKQTVYRKKPTTLAELKMNINEEVERIPKKTLHDVMNALPTRMTACVNCQGKHLKNVIFKK